VEPVQGAGGRQEPGGDVLGVEPRLDRVAGDARRGDLVGQWFAFRDEELQADQVQPGDELGDRVFDLQPGVDLEEVEPPLRVRPSRPASPAPEITKYAAVQGVRPTRRPRKMTAIDAEQSSVSAVTGSGSCRVGNLARLF